MLPERLFPGQTEMVIEACDQDGQQSLPETAVDLGTEPGKHPEIEGEEVVSDAVDPAPAAGGVGHRHDPVDEPQLDEPVQGAGRLSPDMIPDLVVLRAARGDGMQHRRRVLTVFHLGCQHELSLGEQRRPRPAGQSPQVVGDVRVLVPPGQVQRYSADQPVHEGSVGRGELGQHQGGLVRAERMQRQ